MYNFLSSAVSNTIENSIDFRCKPKMDRIWYIGIYYYYVMLRWISWYNTCVLRENKSAYWKELKIDCTIGYWIYCSNVVELFYLNHKLNVVKLLVTCKYLKMYED